MRRSVGLATLLVLAACSAPVPTLRPSVDPSPTPVAPSRSVVPGRLVEIEVRAGGRCLSIPGCETFVQIDGPDGSWHGELGPYRDAGIIATGVLPGSLLGSYVVTLTSYRRSDAIVVNRPRQRGAVNASCTATVEVGPGTGSVVVRGAFDEKSCNVEATTS
jgi:hypothetical protein